ncbi:acyl-[acyl-carrier-protein] thioesterase [Antrihabitans cavernicola]|uniref:Acyl-[acyl-carrier-protein] thioesterase n=1 Tax=Antrihabitans cavernicola TaxID=2495913 RepID=A0A5A7SL35_9NOCA|nr:acyl-ACP thioesterase domain-containing protein [Spelaeibacter cavernicola]KAA0024941.1 hypothetical protein FOY51_03200 [Spelaeibacter cavernicola]
MPDEAEVGHELQELPDDGYIYRTSWPLRTHDMDEDYRLRLDGIARYAQETGAEHLEDAKQTQSHPHWIVQRTVIDVIEPIVWPNSITLRRWCSALSTRWLTMRVRLDGADGGRIETEGFWINMSKDAGGPARISDEFLAQMGTTTDEHRLRWRPWLKEPRRAGDVAEFPLRRTDLDHFEHLTNTVYWHGMHDVLVRLAPELAASPHRAVVEYRKPIVFGEAVTIHADRRGTAVDIWFVVGDEVRAAGYLNAR